PGERDCKKNPPTRPIGSLSRFSLPLRRTNRPQQLRQPGWTEVTGLPQFTPLPGFSGERFSGSFSGQVRAGEQKNLNRFCGFSQAEPPLDKHRRDTGPTTAKVSLTQPPMQRVEPPVAAGPAHV